MFAAAAARPLSAVQDAEPVFRLSANLSALNKNPSSLASGVFLFHGNPEQLYGPAFRYERHESVLHERYLANLILRPNFNQTALRAALLYLGNRVYLDSDYAPVFVIDAAEVRLHLRSIWSAPATSWRDGLIRDALTAYLARALDPRPKPVCWFEPAHVKHACIPKNVESLLRQARFVATLGPGWSKPAVMR